MKALLFLLIIIFFLACQEKENYEQEQRILSRICKGSQTLPQSGNRQLYLITALDGCGACLEHTVSFIEKNSRDHRMIFIISGKSHLQLKAKFRPSIINQPNFLFDTTLIALRQGLIDDGFSRIYLSENGKISQYFSVPAKYADSLHRYSIDFLNGN